MNIPEELLKYHVQSKEQALQIAEYASSSSDRFNELMCCFLSKNIRLAQRAAWSVSWVAQKNPNIIQPHVGFLVNQLGRKDVHNAVIRNSLRVLEDLEIEENYHGEVMNACFDFIQKRETPIAIKAFSLTILHTLSKFYPEIKKELRAIIIQNFNYETPAVRSRAKKILAQI